MSEDSFTATEKEMVDDVSTLPLNISSDSCCLFGFYLFYLFIFIYYTVYIAR